MAGCLISHETCPANPFGCTSQKLKFLRLDLERKDRFWPRIDGMDRTLIRSLLSIQSGSLPITQIRYVVSTIPLVIAIPVWPPPTAATTSSCCNEFPRNSRNSLLSMIQYRAYRLIFPRDA